MKSKKLIIRVVCIVLAVLILCLGVGLIVQSCNKKPAKKKKVIKKVVIVQNDPTIQTPTIPEDFGVVDNPDSSLDNTYERVRRQLSLKSAYVAPDYVPEYKVTEAAWNGPEGYVLVASKNVRACRDAAKLLQAYFKETTGITVPCVTDDAPETAKEILVGDTNRRTSSLKDTEFAVKLEGEKLVFEGGHFAMTETAVDWFISFDYKQGNVNLLTGEIKDFLPSVTVQGKTLDYVWGDEHGGDTLNPQKWCYHARMDGYLDVEYVSGEPYVCVNEGQLKLTAGRYYDMFNVTKTYQTNQSVTSYKQMSYVLGYCEIRAKVPYEKGSWPSYWFLSDDGLRNRYKSDQYPELPKYSCFIEIDFLEALSRKNNMPNLHKFYKSNSKKVQETGQSGYTWGTGDLGNAKITPNVFENPDIVSQEYHTYGLYWTPDELGYYCDNEKYWSFDLTYNWDGIDYDGDWDKHYTDMPVYPIINNYIVTPLGTNGGADAKVDNSNLPFEFFIDYSRYYQQQGVGEINFAEEDYR